MHEVERALHVLELAHVVRAAARRRAPAEEDVGERLHRSLADDDAPPVMRVLAGREVRLEHRWMRFLQLQHEGVVSAREQRDPAVRADASDPDDLPSDVGDLVAMEKSLSLVAQRVPVVLYQRHDVLPLVRLAIATRQQRWRLTEPMAPIDDLGEPADRVQMMVTACTRDDATRVVGRVPHEPFARTGVDGRVPDVERWHRRILRDAPPVLLANSDRDRTHAPRVEPCLTGGDDHAGDEALAVPLPGSRATSRRSH